MTIDATAFRTHFETDLSDAALGRLLDDAYAFCTERAGAQGAQTVVLHSDGRYLLLPNAIASAADIDTIIERQASTETTLTTDDWRWNGGRILERLTSGSPTFWGTTFGFACDVVVTYTPKDDTQRRDRVVIDLVKLALQYNALGSERAGDYQMSADDYTKRRDSLTRQLVAAVGFA